MIPTVHLKTKTKTKIKTKCKKVPTYVIFSKVANDIFVKLSGEEGFILFLWPLCSGQEPNCEWGRGKG